MNRIVFKQIMNICDCDLAEAKEIWQEEVMVQDGDIFEALAAFDLEPDVVI